MGEDEAALCGFGGKGAVRPSRNFCLATSSSSLAADRRSQSTLVRGQYRSDHYAHPDAYPAPSPPLDGAGYSSMVAFRATKPSSKPNSCCRGHSRKKPLSRSTCHSYSTIYGSSLLGPRCSLSLPAAASGWRSESHADPLYQHLIVTAERKFWRCVESGEPPTLFGVDSPKPRIDAIHIVDMSSSNSWAEFAAFFSPTHSAHLEHEAAKAEFKSLVPDGCATSLRARCSSQALAIWRHQFRSPQN